MVNVGVNVGGVLAFGTIVSLAPDTVITHSYTSTTGKYCCGGSQVINLRCWRRSLCEDMTGCQDYEQSEERRAKSEERRASI